ncbi:hypothetical protein T459_35043 [Capsicum annuum]|uniref:F-box associated domain-containing protein n=1 Tax=Capsicum annuum TaxID=4072 RepID=A0A2G2XUC5_CAPAN|nr:hypothetical protein T459_35043 [Capsicum annuum]
MAKVAMIHTNFTAVLLPPELNFSVFLGYDSTSDDYKILKIDGKERNEILALKSGSWRKIDDHPATDNPVLSDMDYLAFQHGALDCVDMPSNMGYLAFVHEAFHWVDSLLNQSVVTFSISDEVYREIPLPEGLDLVFDIMHSKQDGEVLLRCSQLRRSGSVFKTSSESPGVWPQSDSECIQDGFIYTESLITQKLLTWY